MLRKNDFRYVLSSMLVVVALTTAGSGLLSAALDLNEFVPHKYSGYTLAALMALHLYINWPRLVIYWRRRIPVLIEAAPTPSAPSRPAAGVDREGRSRRPAESGTRVPLDRLRVSRRGFGLAVAGAVGGFLLGRQVRGKGQPAIPYGSDVGEVYHEWSKPGYLRILGSVLNWGRQPAQYKHYPEAEKVPLPPPQDFRGLTVEEAIEKRRSVRDYSGEPMSAEELSNLLHCAGGITGQRWGHRLRAAPSAGALYPVELYPVVHHVTGLEQGIYHYSVLNHSLEKLQQGDFRSTMVRHGVEQEFLGQANVVFILSAIFQRTRWKYRERTYRYVMLEAGHIAQNIYLAATSMGMGACAVGAFLDDDLNRLLGLDGEQEAVIYIVAVGKV